MLFMRAVQTVLHWVLLLIEAGTLAWLAALLFSLLGWAAWGLGFLGRQLGGGGTRAEVRTTAPPKHDQQRRQVRPQRG